MQIKYTLIAASTYFSYFSLLFQLAISYLYCLTLANSASALELLESHIKPSAFFLLFAIDHMECVSMGHVYSYSETCL